LKILQAHNYYQQSGGEDTVVAQERQLLENNGHEVIPFYKNNEEITTYSRLDKVKLVKETTWSKKTYREIDTIFKSEKIDICHVHNTLPLISPSIYYACKKHKVPVIQTLHNYRLICTNGLLMRDGKICEDCLGRSAYGAISKKCYRNSAMQTYVVARMLQKNKQMGTWNKQVNAYLCLTEMAKQKFIEHGIPEEKITVKPNFLDVELKKDIEKKDYLLFAGRLTATKGIELIINLANRINYPIKVIGDGDMKEALSITPKVELLGRKSHKETIELMRDAKAILFPTLLYEGMPMTIIEAFALKTPIIATRIGAAESMINHLHTGLLFDYNSGNDFLAKVSFCLGNKDIMAQITKNAYLVYQEKYTASKNYEMLLDIYNSVL